MTFKPTREQQAALDAFGTGHDLVLEAGAGTGKTATLRLLSASTPRRGLYVAFNRAIADEASRDFPRTTQCRTAHSLAYRAVGHRLRNRLNAPRVSGTQAARLLGITGDLPLGGGRPPLAPRQMARQTMDTVMRWCHSADDTLGPAHAALPRNVPDDAVEALTQRLLHHAARAWDDLSAPRGGLRLEHDHYLKMWGLSHPSLDVDYLMLDEAQDTNGVVGGIVADQQAAGTQIVVVGDSNQAIYGWRGAVDAMDAFAIDARLRLSQSFRFGQPVADEANKWLRMLESDLTLSGYSAIDSTLGPAPDADAVLCRTNAEAVVAVMDAQRRGTSVGIVGGGQDVRRLAEASEQLQQRGRTDHPELCTFGSWAQVQEYVTTDFGGGDLATFVGLVDTHGPQAIMRAVDGCVPESAAQVTVSTAHKAKGRQWPAVRVANDFIPPEPDDDDWREEAMLAYVTVTRAQYRLDRGSLAWIDQGWPPSNPSGQPSGAGEERERLSTTSGVTGAAVPPTAPSTGRAAPDGGGASRTVEQVRAAARARRGLPLSLMLTAGLADRVRQAAGDDDPVAWLTRHLDQTLPPQQP